MAPSAKDLIAALDNLGASPGHLTNVERLEVADALRRNYHRLQTPFERVWEMLLARTHTYAAIKTVMDLGLWKAWGAAGGGEKLLDELVEMCDKACAPNLLRTYLRKKKHLTSASGRLYAPWQLDTGF